MFSQQRSRFGAVVLSLAICLGCGASDDDDRGENEGGSSGRFAQASTTSFKISPPEAGACGEVALGTANIFPTEPVLRAKLGTESGPFIVMMREEIDLQQFPLPANRDGDPALDRVWMARAEVIAQSQRCAIAATLKAGGEYQESFVLINAFGAELTLAQAIQLSRRADVRLVEFSLSDTPPP